MSNIVIFGLGVFAGVVVAFVIVTVVIMVRLGRKLEKVRKHAKDLEKGLEDLNQSGVLEIERVERLVGDVGREASEDFRGLKSQMSTDRDEMRSYIDSRLDKAISGHKHVGNNGAAVSEGVKSN